jgi:hypothetical protein
MEWMLYPAGPYRCRKHLINDRTQAWYGLTISYFSPLNSTCLNIVKEYFCVANRCCTATRIAAASCNSYSFTGCDIPLQAFRFKYAKTKTSAVKETKISFPITQYLSELGLYTNETQIWVLQINKEDHITIAQK